jgi:hypothetical protein
MWFPAVLLLLVLVGSAGCSKSPIDRAQEFLDAGMASQAVPLLQIEIQANPKSGRAHMMLGQAQLMLNDQAAAKESFDHALLLNPGWADRVGRAYLDGANRLLSGDYSSVRLAVSYLEAANHAAPSLAKELGRSYRRAGLALKAPQLLQTAVKMNPALALDDSVAAYVAMAVENPEGRTKAMEDFLARNPKSALRSTVLLEMARQAVISGDRPKAKAYAEQVAAVASDDETKSAALSLIQDVSNAERVEADSRDAVRRAEMETQAALARQRLIEQEAQARAEADRARQRLIEQEAQARAEADAAASRAQREAEEKARFDWTFQELSVSARSAEGVSSKPLAPGVRYRLEVSGTYDAWGHTPNAVDAVACFADPQCTAARRAKLAQGFKVDGQGLINLSGGRLSYSHDHDYTVTVIGRGQPLSFYIQDARGSGGDNVGALTVRLTRQP